MDVNAYTGCQVLKKFSIFHLDFLMVDAQGFDDKIVKSFLKCIRPNFIRFEIEPIIRRKWFGRVKEIEQTLERKGYQWKRFGNRDMIAKLTNMSSFIC